MAETYTSIVARFRQRYPNCSETDALALANLVLKELCYDLPLYRDTTDLNLTAGTQEYSLGEAVVQIEKVVYKTSATSRQVLEPTHYDELQQFDTYFEYQAQAKPFGYYLVQSDATTLAGGMRIGFTPTPDTTTSAGYPIVTITHTTKPAADVIGTDQSPDILETPDVIIDAMCLKFAERLRNPEDIALWENRVAKSKTRAWSHINRRLNRYKKPRFEAQSFSRVNPKI